MQGLQTPPRTSTSHLASDTNADLHPPNHAQHGDLPRTENDGGNSWKRLHSSLGLARDDDDDDDLMLCHIV